MAKITLIGMEQFLNPEHSVFEDLELPEGIDKDILIDTILLRCNEFELLYPDPNFMTAAVTVWGQKHYWTFDKWIKVMNKEYDPLYNKDYHEEWTDTHEGEYSKEGSENASGNSSDTSDMTQTNNLAASTSNTDTHSEKAYNNSNFVDTTKDVISASGSNTGTVRNAGTNSNQFGNRSSSSDSGDDSYTNEHTYHGYGNIGIMSSQQLFRDEVSTTSWSIYEAISDMFCSEFCIMIY